MNFSDTEKSRLKNSYGNWAVVTGATSGIGLEIALRLGQAGFSLVLNSRSVAELEKVKQLLISQYNTEVKIVPADASTTEGIKLITDASTNLDVGLLVASAGFGTSGKFIQADYAKELDMLRLNCEGVLALTHHYSRLFAAQNKGGIILLSSMVAFQGVPNAAHYAATKAYIQTLAEGLALELKPHGVDVLAAAPGPVKTGFGTRANMVMDMALSPADVGLPILKALGKKTTVLPGVLTKVLVYSLRTLPRRGKIRVMQKVMQGMTKHQ